MPPIEPLALIERGEQNGKAGACVKKTGETGRRTVFAGGRAGGNAAINAEQHDRSEDRQAPEHPAKGKMVAEPAVHGRSDIHGAIDEACVKGQREWEEAQRNIAQGERERQGIKRAGGETAKGERREQETVAVNERQKTIDNAESGAGDQEDAPGTQKASEIDGERADEHQGDVEGAAEPRALVVADAESSLQVWGTEREKTAREGNDTRAHDDADDAEDGAAGKVRRHGAGQSAGDLPFGWGMQ